MKDDVVPAYQPNSPCTAAFGQQLAQQHPAAASVRLPRLDAQPRLGTARRGRGSAGAARRRSYDRDTNVHLLRQIGDTPVALVNAQPDQARRLVETHPWIRGVFYRATPRTIFVRGIRTLLTGGDWLPRELMEALLSRYRQLSSANQVIDELTLREKQILALAGQVFPMRRSARSCT